MRFPFKHPTEVSGFFLSLIVCIVIYIQILFLSYVILFGCQGLSDKVHHFTLLDGEMIIDTLPDKQRQERRYLIYDMVAINGQSVVEVGTVFLSSIFNGWIGSLVLIGSVGLA